MIKDYVIYVFDGFENDKRFVFSDFQNAFSCFKRFVREDAQVGMFHYKPIKIRSNHFKIKPEATCELVYHANGFPLTTDRIDVTTYDRMGAHPISIGGKPPCV